MNTQRRDEEDDPKLENAALRLPPDVLAALGRIAKAKRVGKHQVLLRAAADAIIRFAEANGDESVPLEMDIRQKIQTDTRALETERFAEFIDWMKKSQPAVPPATPPDPRRSPRK